MQSTIISGCHPTHIDNRVKQSTWYHPVVGFYNMVTKLDWLKSVGELYKNTSKTCCNYERQSWCTRLEDCEVSSEKQIWLLILTTSLLILLRYVDISQNIFRLFWFQRRSLGAYVWVLCIWTLKAGKSSQSKISWIGKKFALVKVKVFQGKFSTT